MNGPLRQRQRLWKVASVISTGMASARFRRATRLLFAAEAVHRACPVLLGSIVDQSFGEFSA